MLQKPLQKNIPLYQKAYEVIKRDILTGKISPGSKISENTLAEQLQISRTPLREAISQLKKDGLLITDNVSTKVMVLNQQDFEGLYECRIALEKQAIKSVVDEITDNQLKELNDLLDRAEELLAQGDYMETLMCNTRFHEVLTKACPNKRLVQFLEQARSLLLLYRANSLIFSEQNLEIFREHREILKAVTERNVEKAVVAIETHLLGDLRRGEKMFEHLEKS